MSQSGCGSRRHVEAIDAKPVEELQDQFNNISSAGEFYFAGYPTVEGLKALRDRGVTTIVSTKSPEQGTERLGQDERELVESLGMRMVYLPISKESFSTKDVDRLADMIEHNEGGMMLHCGSSNTIGALWAAYLHRERNVDFERAFEIGATAGLSHEGMREAAVRVAKGQE